MKQLLTSILLLLSFLPLFGQKYQLHPIELHLGASAGAVGSMVTFSPSIAQQPHLGLYSGLWVKMTNQSYTGLVLQLNYTQRGWQEQYEQPVEYTFRRDFQCLDMRVLTHLYYPIGRVHIGMEVGPSVSYILSDSHTEAPDNEIEAVRLRRHSYPLASRWSWGLAAGPVLSVDWGRNRIEIAAHAYYGLSNLFSTTVSDDYGRSGEVAISVGLAYYFQVH